MRTNTPNPSRRSLLAALPAAGLSASLAPASAGGRYDHDGHTPHPDAAVLAACARMIAVWRKLGVLLEAAGEDDDKWDAAAELVKPEFDAATADLLAARATTLEGIFARALALAETAPDAVNLDMCEGDDQLQLFALLRDVVALSKPSA